MTRPKPKKWFIKVRGSYLPNSWHGWLLYVPFVAYLFAAMVYAWQSNESVFRIVFDLVTQYILAAVVMTWIASQKSK
jgi:hypothetical protein